MKNLFGVALLTGAVLLASPAAIAQTTPVAPTAPNSQILPATKAPTRLPRAGQDAPPPKQQTPEEIEHEKQMRLLESRAGNTSFSAGGDAYRQTDKGNGGFTLRKFKSMKGQEEKRGVSKRVQMGATTNGEPLTRNKRKKNFFSF